jgi:hypothetical protein
MAEKRSDPATARLNSVQKLEYAINRHSRKVTETERFSAWMNRGAKLKLLLKQAVAEQMGNYLRTINMPSKVEVDEIGERLDALEESLERLRRLLTPADAEKRTREPKRSRKPPVDPV